MIEPAVIAKRAKRAVDRLHRRDIGNKRLDKIVEALEVIEAEVTALRKETAPKRQRFVPPAGPKEATYDLELPDDHRSLRGKRRTGDKVKAAPAKKKPIKVKDNG